MNPPKATTRTEGRDLILNCLILAPPEKVFRAWTDPALLTQWFTPAPWTTASAQMDVRPGGSTEVGEASAVADDHVVANPRGVCLQDADRGPEDACELECRESFGDRPVCEFELFAGLRAAQGGEAAGERRREALPA